MKPTQSGSSSSSSANPGSYQYDVFLSAHDDTRQSFASHLYKALIQQEIKTFFDSSLRFNEDILATTKAIEESRSAIIILSENYADSRWCLEELTHIIDEHSMKNIPIFPVFYLVDPSNVLYQTGKWGEAFDKHVTWAGFQDVAKVAKWRDAASKVACLSGIVVSEGRSESDLVDHIVEKVLAYVIKPSDLHVADCPVGIESRVHDMVKLVRVGGDDAHMVGIWGLGGIGKTTVAKAVYNLIKQEFDHCCFLANIRENAEKSGLTSLQNLLLFPMRRINPIAVFSVDEGINMIRRYLSHKRILLVLDDVDELEQLTSLAGGSYWFGPGSRVIITTRDKHLLIAHGVSSIYEVGQLDHNESLMLFSYYSFPETRVSKEDHAAVIGFPNQAAVREALSRAHHSAVSALSKALPRVSKAHHAAVPGVPKEHYAAGIGFPEEYWNLAIDAVQYAEGLPLALKVLGSFLCGRPVEEWQEARDGDWFVGTQCLYETLRRSFDSLDCLAKEVFLDIACFFKGEHKNLLIQLLKDFYPIITIKFLQDKALISINDDNHIWMHHSVEVMGKYIVYNESPNEPSKRSRLCDSEDVSNVLTESTGTNNVIGIMVKLPEPDEIILNATSFSVMRSLKYFINYNASFSGYVDNLPDELRLIDWPDFHLESLPINFSPRKLVKLNMPRSHISRLGETFKCSKNLIYMNLESCLSLTELPNFSTFPDLKCLNLSNCSSLIELDDSVGFLYKLVILNLSGCSSLIKFPRRVALKSVRYISLRGCGLLKSFPKIVKKMKWLKNLDLSGTAIMELPSPIAFLNSLEELTMRNCENLTDLPGSIYELQNLWSLDLQDCSKLENFPKWSAELVKGSNNLPDLCYLNLCGCKRLQVIPELPPKVKWVNSGDCSALRLFAKLSNILERKESQMIKCVSLLNCRNLCESLFNQLEQNEQTLLNEGSLCSIFLSCKDSEFDVVFPGTEVPKWFRHRKNVEEIVGPSEFSFEIPPNFKSGDIGLAICAAASVYGFGPYCFPATSVDDSGHCSFTATISIQKESTLTRSFNFEAKDMESDHVWLLYIPLIEFVDSQLPPITCRVRLEHTSRGSIRCKSYGVHLVMPRVENSESDEET